MKHFYMAMGQNPNRAPGEHPNPTTKIGSKMGGEFTYQPKWDPKTVLTTTAIWAAHKATYKSSGARQRVASFASAKPGVRETPKARRTVRACAPSETEKQQKAGVLSAAFREIRISSGSRTVSGVQFC